MSTTMVENVDETLATWQQAIYQECLKIAAECGASESSIDGACSDGDELAFTLAEIGQAFNLLRDERDAARQEVLVSRAQVQRLREALERIPHGTLVCDAETLGHIGGFDGIVNRLYETARIVREATAEMELQP